MPRTRPTSPFLISNREMQLAVKSIQQARFNRVPLCVARGMASASTVKNIYRSPGLSIGRADCTGLRRVEPAVYDSASDA
mmetsp:Transcript_1879/g.6894  ORF Transcript_1879/g.6894 Transcript_1879/m.6894 type:complete len:80 (-) Transcript_1879:104-343(-)